jgi:hypothetical protein
MHALPIHLPDRLMAFTLRALEMGQRVSRSHRMKSPRQLGNWENYPSFASLDRRYADPQVVVSSRRATIFRLAGLWKIADTSNDIPSISPIGPERVR